LGHLGPLDSKMVFGHVHAHFAVSRISLLPSYLAIRGGLHASQKLITPLGVGMGILILYG